MKTIKYFILLISSILLTGCSESFFERYPFDELNEQGFFDNARNFEYSINAAYDNMRDVYGQLFYFDLASDDEYADKFNAAGAITYGAINELDVMSDNSVISNFWDNSYKAINRCNLVLDNIDKAEMDAEIRKRLKGEAFFLRSLLYFNMVRIFGGIPLVTKDLKTPEEALAFGRSTVDQVYNDLIIPDLERIITEQLLPTHYTENANIGRATRYATHALLGKVYLTRHDYAKAKNHLKTVHDNPGIHTLLPDYADIFDATNPNNPEILFAVQYASGLTRSGTSNMGNPYCTAAMPNEQTGQGLWETGGNGMYLMTYDLYRRFDLSDIRINQIDTAWGSPTRPIYDKYVFTLKYRDKTNTTVKDSGNDWLVLRFADVLLMYAEVLAEDGDLAGAEAEVRAIRERAGLTTMPPMTTKAEAKQAIADERRLELFCEGHRWFDLLRTETVKEVMTAHFNGPWNDYQIGANVKIEDSDLLFPLPKFEVDLNPDVLKQN
ncbi:MAG: RagB/SusD family nutrient uptake outer membrane protein [Tannerella sp.]|jgi:hypothetical protein|nr:RagB/SusD family nutrient uptake outer membrane protein [Tannerella sp.]